MLTELKNKYPELMGKCFDFSIGNGWVPEVLKAIEDFEVIRKNNPELIVNIAQIKEKFGGIRFYYDCDNFTENVYNQLSRRIDELEKALDGTCEVCGNTTNDVKCTTKIGWIRTLCAECRGN